MNENNVGHRKRTVLHENSILNSSVSHPCQNCFSLIRFSQGFSCPVAFDEAEYYVKILAKRANGDMQISNARSSQEIENYSTKICRAYDDSVFSKVPTFPLRSTDSRKFSSFQ